jgi:hypothetical protein
MRPLLLAALLIPAVAHADDSLRCDVSRAGKSETFSSSYSEGQAETQNNTSGDALGLGFDSSLSSSTYLVVLQDNNRQRRVAFTGSNAAITPDSSSSLSNGDSSIACRNVPAAKASSALPPSVSELDYFVCMLDEAHMVNGSPDGDPKRHAMKQISPLAKSLSIENAAEDASASFKVHYLSYDSLHGLVATITDKATGETATYSGPARSMGASFMLGLTLGDRDKDARLLRLGCVWTDDPSSFK